MITDLALQVAEANQGGPGTIQISVNEKVVREFFVKDRYNVYDWYNALSVLMSYLRITQTALMLLVTRGRPQSTVLCL